MRSDDLPYPIQSFLSKLKYFTLFNVLFALWTIAELIFYIVVTVDINCSKMQKLFISWTCSYAFELIVPIASLLIVHYSKFYRVGYGYITLLVAYKIGVVITVLAVAWKHVGLCYIPYGMRVTVILTNCLQVLCLMVEMLLLSRIKKVNREVLLNNLVKKKIFAEN